MASLRCCDGPVGAAGFAVPRRLSFAHRSGCMRSTRLSRLQRKLLHHRTYLRRSLGEQHCIVDIQMPVTYSVSRRI